MTDQLLMFSFQPQPLLTALGERHASMSLKPEHDLVGTLKHIENAVKIKQTERITLLLVIYLFIIIIIIIIILLLLLL